MECGVVEWQLNFCFFVLIDDYDIKYYWLEWNINFNNYYIFGMVMIYFMFKEANFVVLYFDFVNILQVNSVIFYGQEVEIYS